MAENKEREGKTTSSKAKKPAAASSQAKRKVSDRVQELGEQAASTAAKVEKAAEEISEEFNQTVEEEIVPAAERAGKKVTEAGKKVREQVNSTAQKARKSVAETKKKVKEELGPPAEKAGKGISDVLKATARATRKSARILGIKASIAAELRKRQRLFSMLGEAYFRAQKKKTPAQADQDALKSLVTEIEQADAAIKALEVKEKTTRASV